MTTAAPRRPSSWRRYIGVAPLILFLILLFIYPIVDLLWLSFFDKAGELTGEHYRAVVAARDDVWLNVMMITFEIAAWTTLFCVLAGYPVAYLLATAPESTRNRLLIWVMLPFWTSFLVRTFAWIVLLSQKGPINRLVAALGLSDAPLELIYNFTGTMIGMVHALMPLAVLTMLSVMTNIDPRLRGAAATLGARGGATFWRIYFPLSLPGVAAAGLMVFITALGFFITPALLGGRRQTMISQVIIIQVQDLLNWSFAGALSVVLLAAALLIFILYDRLLGLSTLSGEARTGGGRQTWIGRAGNFVGGLVVAALGWLCDLAQRGWEAIRPPRGDRARRPMARGALWAVVLTIIGFLVLPALIVVPVSFTGGSFVNFPPEGLSLRWYAEYLGSSVWMEATVRSFAVAALTGVLAMLLGVPAAFMLVRSRARAKAGLLALILSPLIIPRIVVAVAIYIVYARVGLVGTSVGLVLGHTVLAVPYVVITMMAVLKTYDERLDQAAASLGASPWRTLTKITFPLLRGGMIASFLFAFITSFDELTISLFVSGGLVSTLPRQMWNDMLLQVNPTLAAVSTTMLVVITAIILGAEYLRRRAVKAS